jgi:hypothetical protein
MNLKMKMKVTKVQNNQFNSSTKKVRLVFYCFPFGLTFFKNVCQKGGYGWLVVISTIVCGGITGSNSINYPLVQDKLIVEFNNTENSAIIAGA